MGGCRHTHSLLILWVFRRGELDVARRSIGQERFDFAGRTRSSSLLDECRKLIDWGPVTAVLDPLYSATKGEPAWPPLAMFKALLQSIWYDLSDVKLAGALDDRASFRRFCGFSTNEAAPDRTAFVRYRRLLVAHKLDRSLFETVTMQLKSKAVAVKTGTLVDATIIASASEGDDDARWVKHKGKRAVHGFKAHVGADADTALVEEVSSHLPISTRAKQVRTRCPIILVRCLPTAPIAAITSVRLSEKRAAYRGSSPLGCGAATNRKRYASSINGINRSIASGVGSRRPSEPRSAATVCAECYGEVSSKPQSQSTSSPSHTTSSAP